MAARKDARTVMSERPRVPPDVLRMKLLGANPTPQVIGLEELPGKSNYLLGKDPECWRTNVAHYAKVRYESVYPGVDMVYYGNQQQLEYDFILAPGADPSTIRLAFEGAHAVEIDTDGNLILRTKGGAVRQPRPFIYQETDGRRREIAGRYVKLGARQIGFEVGEYDASAPLVIDPVLVYSTYLGGTGVDQGLGIAVDAGGNVYVTGSTFSPFFPTTTGVFDPTVNGGTDAFVTKLAPSGTTLVYSTYLGGGGSLNSDVATGIAIDVDGNVYLAGGTTSNNFPVTAGAYNPFHNGASDAFVAKLNATGSALIYSTYLGAVGTDYCNAIAIDAGGNAYVTGATNNSFPTTPGAFDTVFNGSNDVFVSKLSASGSTLIYSTYVGGTGGGTGDIGYSIAVDAAGNAYVTGETSSTNFPVTPNSFDTSFNGGIDAFVTKLNPTGTALVYSTFLGGGTTNSDRGLGITLDAAGTAYVTGSTSSSNFPTTLGAFDTTINGTGTLNAFVARLNDSGSALLFSTYLGGANSSTAGNIGYAVALDGAGNVYVTGETASPEFPTTPGAFDATYNSGTSGTSDAFVAQFDAAGTTLLYSTYLGGNNTDRGRAVAVGADGSAYVTGDTLSPDFSTTAGSFDVSFNGGNDAFIAKFGESAPTPTPTPNPTPSPTPTPCPTVNLSPAAVPVGVIGMPYSLAFTPTGGTAPYTFAESGTLPPSLSLSAAGHLTGTPTTAGTFNFTVTATDANGCAGAKSYTLTVSCPVITLGPATLPAGTVGTAYDQLITAAGGTSPYGFVTAGSLPAGLGLDAAGRLHGTPSTYGSFSFNVTVTDAFGCMGAIGYNLVVNPTPEPTPTPTPAQGSCNVALASNGATATASSQFGFPGHPSGFYPASGVIDGEHDGNNWGEGGGWNDATNEVFPDGVEVTFNAPQTIQEIHLYTMKNVPNDGTTVNDFTPANVYGISSFRVEYYDGSNYQNVLGGVITANTLAKRRFVFPPVTTDRIRVVVNDSADHLFSRIVEIEAFTCNPGCTASTPRNDNWRIAFESNRDGNSEIYLADADGRNLVRLTNDNSRDADPFFSPDGSRIVFPTNRHGNYEIYVMNADGSNQTRLTNNSVDDHRPAFSPDGTKIAFQRGGGNSSEIYVMNADGTNQVRITNNSVADMFPKWSPDGTKFIFHSDRDGDSDIYTMNVDGSNVVKLTNNNSHDHEASFSPDGSKILFSSDRTGNTEVWTMNADGSQPVNMSNSSSTDGSCSWSADGTKVLFVSSRDGNTEVYTMNPDGTGQTRLTINGVLENTPVSGFLLVPRVNVALAANGATAAASSTHTAYSLAAINSGDRKGPGHGGVWGDATSNVYPDWVEFTFAGAKSIDEVSVFSVQDNGFTTPVVEPTQAMTGTQYVVTSFEVQYWTGSAWASVPGGMVTGNNLIWRKVTFPEVTTTKVRVQINATSDNYSQVPEIEVWGRTP